MEKDKKFKLSIIKELTDRELFLLVKYDDIKIYGTPCDFKDNILREKELIQPNYFPPNNHLKWAAPKDILSEEDLIKLKFSLLNNHCKAAPNENKPSRECITYEDDFGRNVFVYRDVFIYGKDHFKLQKAILKNWLLEFKYVFTIIEFIPFEEALNLLHKHSEKWINNIAHGWESIGVSITQILEQQLLILLQDHEINLYGFKCLASEKISNKKEVIPTKFVPCSFPLTHYKWGKDTTGNNNYVSIYSWCGELMYTEISMKIRDLKRAIGNHKKQIDRIF